MPQFRTRAGLRAELEQLGVEPDDTVMVHAALSRVGRMLNGPDAVIGAVLDAASPGGTAGVGVSAFTPLASATSVSGDDSCLVVRYFVEHGVWGAALDPLAHRGPEPASSSPQLIRAGASIEGAPPPSGATRNARVPFDLIPAHAAILTHRLGRAPGAPGP